MNIGFKYAGGTFSYFMILLDNLIVLKPTTPLYVDNRVGAGSFKHSSFNFFDVLLNQRKHLPGFTMTSFHKDHSNMSDEYLQELHQVSKLLKIKESILDEAEEIVSGENVLGVHIRLTTFNHHHKNDYNTKSYEDYVNKIKEVVAEKQIDKIFVASDNDESLEKLKQENLPQIVHINCSRYKLENENDVKLSQEYDNINDESFYYNAMLDAVCLSKCHYNIGRPSGLNNFARVLSSTIKQHYSL